jgi:hypothetical protein
MYYVADELHTGRQAGRLPELHGIRLGLGLAPRSHPPPPAAVGRTDGVRSGCGKLSLPLNGPNGPWAAGLFVPKPSSSSSSLVFHATVRPSLDKKQISEKSPPPPPPPPARRSMFAKRLFHKALQHHHQVSELSRPARRLPRPLTSDSGCAAGSCWGRARAPNGRADRASLRGALHGLATRLRPSPAPPRRRNAVSLCLAS